MMKHITKLIVIIFIIIPISISAQNDHHSQIEVRELLYELDTLIANKKYYQDQRRLRVSNIEKELRDCYGKEYVDKCKEYFQSLVDFDGCKALHALQLIEDTPEYQKDKELMQWVAISRATVYCTMGLYHKAEDMLFSIDTKNLSEKERLHYHCTIQAIYSNIAEYLPEKDVVHDENNLSISYMDSILSIQTNEIDRDLTSAVKELSLNHPTEALNHALHALYLSKGKTHIYICATLGMVYKSMHDNQNAIYYFALTSINDIKNGTTEYQALIYLIDVLYEEGDMDRATAYLMCAMEDVNAYPARNLAIKLASNVKNMNKTLTSRQMEVTASAKQNSHTTGIIYALSAILICIAFYVFWRRSNSKSQKAEIDNLQANLERIKLSDRLKTSILQKIQKDGTAHLAAIKEKTMLLTGRENVNELQIYKNSIAEHADSIAATIDSMNDINKLDVAKNTECTYSMIDFDEMVNTCLDDTRKSLNPNVELIYSPQHKGFKLCTNADRVKQMLSAILTLATKNTDNGAIMLSTIHISSSDDLQVCIANTGKQLSEKEANLMFEQFEDNAEEDSSCRITLYTCRIIARSLGGDLSIDTSYMQGVRIILIIPNKK